MKGEDESMAPDIGGPPHPRVIDSLVLRIRELELENKWLRLPEDLVHTLEMCEARATRMMRGEDAGIAPIVSCLRDILIHAKVGRNGVRRE